MYSEFFSCVKMGCNTSKESVAPVEGEEKLEEQTKAEEEEDNKGEV